MSGLYRIFRVAVVVLVPGCEVVSGPPAAVHLAFRVQPSVTTSGLAFAPPVVVTINDVNNRVLPVDTLVRVYLRDYPRASSGGTVSVRSIQGVATFDDLHIDGAGSGYTLSAVSDVAADSAISDTFSVRFTPTITYNSNYTGGLNREVYGTTLDGSVTVNLTHDPATDVAGPWSPDGARVLVQSDRNGDQDLYALDSNSLVLTNLTQHAGNDYNGSWFPDGQRVAFLSDRDGDGGGEIYVMNADGSAQTRLTYDSGVVYIPIISPDGAQILFTTSRGGMDNAFVMGVDGSNRIRLTTDTTLGRAFDWSPRGDQIAFGAGHHLILARPDGSNPVEIAGDTVIDSTQAFVGGAVFSPDGSRLAFTWFSGRNPGAPSLPDVVTVEVSNIDGSGLKPLFQVIGGGVTEWSPDGAWLLISSGGLEGVYTIGLVRPDGSDDHSLASGSGAHFRP